MLSDYKPGNSLFDVKIHLFYFLHIFGNAKYIFFNNKKLLFQIHKF